MLGFLPSLLSLSSYGLNTTIAKKAINEMGRYKSICYVYLFMFVFLVLFFFLAGIAIEIPFWILPLILAQVVIGTVAIIARYRALELGRAAVVSPLSKLSVILVFIIGIFVFGEQPSAISIFGASLVIIGSVILALEKGRLEKGAGYLTITIILWGVYFSMLKIFVETLGAFQATLVLEIGIMLMIWTYYTARGRDLSIPKKGTATVMLSGLLSAAGAYTYNISIGMIGIALTGGIVAATPVLNAIFARFILQEKLSKAKYLAILLSLAGMILVILFK